MANYDLVLQSAEYGGASTVTVAGVATFTLNSAGAISFQQQPGGSGAAEVKISTLELTPTHVTVVRNGGDGTHFTLGFAIQTDLTQVSVTITNSQGGGPNPAASFVKVIRPGVDQVSSSTAGPTTQNLRLV